MLDWMAAELARVRKALDPTDRLAMDKYLDNIRELERRLALVEARNSSGDERALPDAPASVPDRWADHVEIMFDLQVLALEADLTRVISFKIGKDLSNRVFPESGVNQSHHAASHHGNKQESLLMFNAINTYKLSVLPYLLEKLKNAVEGGTSLLEKTAVVWGSSMGDPNVHAHRRAPLLFLGRANGALEGNMHVRTPDGTPMANAMFSLLQGIGHQDLVSFGDSTYKLELTSAGAAT
jgi:hypothetical protein